MTTEAEIFFINRIGCSFPYHDKKSCLKLIEEAATLSTNAMFYIIEEICRIPTSEREHVATDFLLDLLSIIRTKFNHPLKEMVLETACKIVKGQRLAVDEVIIKMETIKNYKKQYAALSILYFSCDGKDEA